MSINFSLELNGKYIHIVHPPDYEITPESQKKLWKELSQAFRKYNCKKVLAEGFTPKRQIGTVDTLDSGSQASKFILGLMFAICLQEYVPGERTKYFTNVAHNRGTRTEFFTDKKKALKWLGIIDAKPQPRTEGR